MSPIHFFIRFYNRSRTPVSQHPGMFASFSILAATVLGKFRLRFLLLLALIINIFYGLKTGIGIVMSCIGNQLILFFYESAMKTKFGWIFNKLELKKSPAALKTNRAVELAIIQML